MHHIYINMRYILIYKIDYRQTSIQRTVWEAKSIIRCIEIRFIENAWKRLGKFFKRNLLLNLIHFLKCCFILLMMT
jgi:hypothetical protein